MKEGGGKGVVQGAEWNSAQVAYQCVASWRGVEVGGLCWCQGVDERCER